jgi:dienelactone hydrolase
MKSPGTKTLLRRLLLVGRMALVLTVIGSGFPAAHAETFKFESKPVLSRYTATIGGELSFPQGAGPFPVVILLHACGGLDQWAKASLSAHARSLIKAGFATYILDSFSARGLTANDVCDGPKGREASEFRLDDLFNAKDALQKHSRVNKTSFFAVGESHGATVALWAAVNTALREPFRAVAAFYPDCRALRHSLKLKSAAIIFAAEKDDWTPAPLCDEAKKKERAAGEEIELITYPDAYHGFDQQRPKLRYKGHTMAYDEQASTDSRKRMQEFFVRYLRGPPSGASSSPKKGFN